MSARLRQVVLVATDLEAAVDRLRAGLALDDPFSDPGVSLFGLRNAVFALQDTFLEVISPVRADTAGQRLLARRGEDGGYMLMLQVEDLPAARERARRRGVREVFQLSLPDMAEAHLHPADMRGGIVSLSTPQPPESWRWGGPDWERRAAPVEVLETVVGVADPLSTEALWRELAGEVPGLRFVSDPQQRGIRRLRLRDLRGSREPLRFGSVQIEWG